MIIQVANILPKESLDGFTTCLSSTDSWVDGKSTAKGHARKLKNNLQLYANAPGADRVFTTIGNAISSNRMINAAIRPKRFARIIVSRYEVGMSYGAHVDAAFMDNVRCDVSFTVFLSDPATYGGGDLAIHGPNGEQRFKLKAGDILLYPSTYVHRVEAVVSGTRQAAIGWIESRIRSVEQRLMLFDLDRSIAELETSPSLAETRTRLANLRNNLLRTWSD